MHITQQQAAAKQKAQKYTFLDFCSMGSDDFDEDVMMHGRWLGLCRDDAGILQVYAEFVFDDANCTGNDDAMGTAWWL
jgi:hypothetical protein